MNELQIVNKTEISFHNPKLTNAVKRIVDAANRMEKSGLQMSAEIGNIFVKGLWEEDFESFADFADKVFHIKRVQAYNMVKVAGWLKETKSGGYIGTSVLAGINPDYDADFSPTKLLVINQILGADNVTIAENLVRDGLLSPYMSVSQIRDYLKNWKAMVEADNDETPPDAPDEPGSGTGIPAKDMGDEPEQTAIDMEESKPDEDKPAPKPKTANGVLIDMYAANMWLYNHTKTLQIPEDVGSASGSAKDALDMIIKGLRLYSEVYNLDAAWGDTVKQANQIYSETANIQ